MPSDSMSLGPGPGVHPYFCFCLWSLINNPRGAFILTRLDDRPLVFMPLYHATSQQRYPLPWHGTDNHSWLKPTVCT